MTTAEDTFVQGVIDEIADKVAAKLLAGRDDRPLLSIDEAMARLNMGRRTLYEAMARGEIAWIQVGNDGAPNARKIEAAEIDRFIAARRQRVDPQVEGEA